jgi:hypothetical protein
MALVEELHRSGLAEIASLGEDNFQALRSADLVSPGEKDIPSRVAESALLAGESARQIVASLVSLVAYQVRDADMPQFVKDVSKEMRTGGTNAIKIAPEQVDAFQQRLADLLKNEPLRVRAKAGALMFENPQVFQNARILTDLRPVFSVGKELSVSGTIIKHDLRIEFYAREGGYKQFFVTMDDADVRQLKLTLDRAERKAELLRSLLQKCHISDLNPEGPESNA